MNLFLKTLSLLFFITSTITLTGCLKCCKKECTKKEPIILEEEIVETNKNIDTLENEKIENDK